MNKAGVWTTEGFDGFREGTFGNAGQNLYVSRAGVLQRIHQYDLNGNGYVDLVFCNDHDHGDKPPTYVYGDPFGNVTLTEVPSDGSSTGAVADLNGDGYDDLVLAMRGNGKREDLNAFVYYGSPDGLSERRHQLLPAPACVSVAAGDFNGDGRPDLAFVCQAWEGSHVAFEKDRYVRVFYQSELGFEPKGYVDLDIAAWTGAGETRVYSSKEQVGASDLDGDGYADLIVRSNDGNVNIYWGGPQGLDPAQATSVQVAAAEVGESAGPLDIPDQPGEEFEDEAPQAQAVVLGGVPHVFVPQEHAALLVPVDKGRRFGQPIVLGCTRPLAVAVGDVSGNGSEDLVVACRQRFEDAECSWVYWGSDEGYDDARRTPLRTTRACDVAVGDLDGDGRDEIVLCEMRSEASYTADSLVYRVDGDGNVTAPVKLQTEDARRVFLARPAREEKPKIVFVNRHNGRNALGDIDSTVYFGGPDGFSSERRKDIPSFRAVEAICCDVNDDGYVDIVLANSFYNTADRKPGSYVLLNGPGGFPDEPSMSLPIDRVQGAACADLNRDGYLDVVFAVIGSPDLVVFYGTAEGFDTDNPQRIHLERDGVVHDEPRWICLADLNNNGWLDLFVPDVGSERSIVLWGGPDGFTAERSQILSAHHAACARTADFTGNGYLDLIVGGHTPSLTGPLDSFAYIYWNGPDGLREDRRTILPANAINSMAVADFNNDGQLDLYIGSYHDARERDIDSYIYWNREGKGFSAIDRTRLPTHSASGSLAADFNENGWVDLAIAYHRVESEHKAYSAVWWNGPDGFDEKNVTLLPTGGPHGISSVDPGNLADRGPEEYYMSAPFQLPEGSSVASVSWEADTPAKAWVKAQLRSADAKEGLETATWEGSDGTDTWYEKGQNAAVGGTDGGWVQFRLALGSTNSLNTPRLTRVDVHYRTDE